MIEIIEALNHTSPSRTVFYTIAFLIFTAIAIYGLAEIVRSLRK